MPPNLHVVGNSTWYDPANIPAPPPYCYQWINPDDALRHAMAAFYTACRFADHNSRAFPDEPASRETWLCDFLTILELRCRVHAADSGVSGVDTTDSKEALEGYTEPGWIPISHSPRETQHDIHCRASHNESSR